MAPRTAAAPETPGASILEARRPSLFWTESKLAEAIVHLDTEDPDEQMTAEDAQAFLAEFVSPQAVVARRDEFARFLLMGEALVAAKRAEADALSGPLLAQAYRVEGALAKMRSSTIAILKAAGVEGISGDTYTLKLKHSRGTVAIDDEAQVPDEFWRTKADDDLHRIERLEAIVGLLVLARFEDADELGVRSEVFADAVAADEFMVEAKKLLADARAERRAIDKKLIQAEWKEHGDTRHTVDPETGEVIEVPIVPGVHKAIETTLVVE